MQNPVVVIGGLEKSYMQKLVLYLNTRIGKNGYVELIDGQKDWSDMIPEERGGEKKKWGLAVGSESFVQALYEAGMAEQILILTDMEDEDETHICQYQSRTVLFQKIIARYQINVANGLRNTTGKKQRWIACIGGNRGQLTGVSILCAWILAQKQRVLYIDFAENSGLMSLFQTGFAGEDLSDLFLKIRKADSVSFEVFTSHLDGIDYIQPASNPMILYEIQEENMQEFLNLMNKELQYETVVFSMGSLVCGSQYVFSQANQILLIHQEDLCSRCVAEEEMDFLKKCSSQEKITELILPELTGDMAGMHLLREWSESETGKRLRKWLDTDHADESGK